MSNDRIGDDEKEAGSCMIYECDDRYVGVHHADGDVKFFANGATPDECLQDMLDTLNYLPQNLQQIRDDEAKLVDVIPLKRTAAPTDE